MEIQPIVVGTAGHIDHGKSTLVRALTGVDPDRLKEERERGMTIDLGFAPLELPDGRLVGIVDVPGHERFIRNMVAGASGIDLVVLVVASDDGVMPQTREHLQIMELLGVSRGFVALTKIDLVDGELVDLAEEDVRESVQGTFLDGAPILRVAAQTGEGMDELKAVLFEACASAQPPSSEGVFRMPIQRVFSKQGFGTIVTGVPTGGHCRVGDVLEVIPGHRRVKVRGLNAYGQGTEQIRSGHSSAVNITDVTREEVRRGFVLATPNFYSPLRMVAARLTALPSLDRNITDRMPIRLHSGTVDAPGEIVLLDSESVAPGASALVQLRLDDPVVCAPGDRFVLRLLSPVVTLGGGTILEESRHRLKRFKGFVLDELARQEASLESPTAFLESILARQDEGLATTADLAQAIKRDTQETRAWLTELLSDGRVLEPRSDRWIHVDRFGRDLVRLRSTLDHWFAQKPHRLRADILEIRQQTGLESSYLDILVESEKSVGRLQRLSGGALAIPGRQPKLSAKLEKAVAAVASCLAAAGYQPPDESELASSLGLEPEMLVRALEHLGDEGRLVHVGGPVFMDAACVERAREAVVANCRQHGHLEIPGLRDSLGTSRKFLIPLLEHFDRSGVTSRQGAHRVLKARD